MAKLLQELDKAIENKRITMLVEHDVTNDIYKIYLRDNIDKTEHLYTKIGLRRYMKPITE